MIFNQAHLHKLCLNIFDTFDKFKKQGKRTGYKLFKNNKCKQYDMELNGMIEFLYFCQLLDGCKRLHKSTVPDVVVPFYQGSGSFFRQNSPLVVFSCWTNIDFLEVQDNHLEDTSPIVFQGSVTIHETPLCLLEIYLFRDHRKLPWSPILCSNSTSTSIGNFSQF